MQLIETVTVGSGGAASITFSAIPQEGFTDLYLLLSAQGSSTNVDLTWARVTFNGSTTGYSYRKLFGTGSAAGSDTSADVMPQGPSGGATFGNGSMYIPNYTSSNFKSYSADSVSEDNATKSYQNIQAGLWSNTAAITSITIVTNNGGNWQQYSSASLYGITAGSDGIVAVS